MKVKKIRSLCLLIVSAILLIFTVSYPVSANEGEENLQSDMAVEKNEFRSRLTNPNSVIKQENKLTKDGIVTTTTVTFKNDDVNDIMDNRSSSDALIEGDVQKYTSISEIVMPMAAYSAAGTLYNGNLNVYARINYDRVTVKGKLDPFIKTTSYSVTMNSIMWNSVPPRSASFFMEQIGGYVYNPWNFVGNLPYGSFSHTPSVAPVARGATYTYTPVFAYYVYKSTGSAIRLRISINGGYNEVALYL